MDVPEVSALSALAGSVVGGLTSTGMTWLTQRAQTRSDQRAHEFTRREDLYRDFIVAASKTYGEQAMIRTSRSIFGDNGRARDAGFPGGNPIDQL